jgi:hypothetical protein
MRNIIMSDLNLPESLTERIQTLAEQEHRSVEEIITRMLQAYSAQPRQNKDDTPDPDPLLGLIGLLDDETQETNLSSTVRETLKQYTHPQYGWTKRDRTD